MQKQTEKKKGILKQSFIQPDKKTNKSNLQKIINALDIFSFIPIPQSFPVSTKKSKIGSALVILFFVAYVLYDFISFLTNNTPKVNSYLIPLPNTNYVVPEMAIGFIYGPGLNMTLNDSSYFTIQLQQMITNQGQGTSINLNLYPCQQLKWLSNVQQYYQNLSCVNTSEIDLSGIIYSSPLTYYPRFIINLCNLSNISANCQTLQAIQNMTSGGRIFFFMQKNLNVDFSSIENAQKYQSSTFYMYNYFLVPGFYNRVIISLLPTSYLIYPDYVHRFKMQQIADMNIVGDTLQISNVSYFNPLNLFSINIQLTSQVMINDIVYSTIIDKIAMWGALWGVIFGFTAVILITYNKNMFHQKNPNWKIFEEKIEDLQRRINSNNALTINDHIPDNQQQRSRRQTFDQISNK